MTEPKHIAIVGVGLAAISCARTLVQAGHRVTLLEKSHRVGGRMATRSSPFGSFDHGAQYFTVRDSRFQQALQTTPKLCKAWSANTVRVLDEHGNMTATRLPPAEPHWVPAPGMNALPQRWAQSLLDAGCIEMHTKVTQIEADALAPRRWQLRTAGQNDATHVYSGFDAVVLAIPAPQARALLDTCAAAAPLLAKISKVTVAPCWTLMLAFPQAVQPGLLALGPQWNAARSTHNRIAWLARESSKPGRESIERWTVQANAQWSADHMQDDAARVQAKLLKAFAEVTGIHAQPAHVDTHRWLYAQTIQPLGVSHLWDAKTGLGLCGDWCLGHRVENAFVSGLELALSIV
ncbi:MAG: FAD-dependent oxidoreductase [Rhodoferax sp.]|nr:FAD-dependent oxidoreductase [Rhodoferax sp.]